jgi:DNA-directed RNA polymerase II subunit RPB4
LEGLDPRGLRLGNLEGIALTDRVFATEQRAGFLNKFEIAQILYLRPEKVEVAIALIPRYVHSGSALSFVSQGMRLELTDSLERYSQGEDEEKLQDILDEIRNIARFGQA